MTSSKIERAIALGISSDTSLLQREMRQVGSILRQVKDPTESLRVQLALLNDQLKQGEIGSRQFGDAQAKAEAKAARQRAAIEKVRAEYKALQQQARATSSEENRVRGLKVQAGIRREVESVAAHRRELQKRLTVFKQDKAAKEASAQAAAKLAAAEAEQQRRLNEELKQQRKLARDLANQKRGLQVQAGIRQEAQSVAQHRQELQRRLTVFKRDKAAKEASARAAARLAAAERERLRNSGIAFMRQFETSQQRMNRQLTQAASLYSKTAIGATEYSHAVMLIRREHSHLHRVFRQMTGAVTTMVGPLVLLTGTIEGVRRSLQLSADLEAARAKFKVLTGSVVEAERTMRQLRELSSRSPVSFVGGQRATATMLQFGVATQDVIGHLKSIAEVTAGDTQRMEMLSLSFAQTQAAGRLMGQELLQSVNAGFNPLKIISEQTGESLVELKKRMEAGGVSSEEVAKTLHDATAEGGRFHGLLKEIANTTSGKMTRAYSELEQAGTAFGDALKPVTNLTLDKAMLELQGFRSLMNDLVYLSESLQTNLSSLGLKGEGFDDINQMSRFLHSRIGTLPTFSQYAQSATMLKESFLTFTGQIRTARDEFDQLNRIVAVFGEDSLIFGTKRRLDELKRQFENAKVSQAEFKRLAKEYRQQVAELKKRGADREDIAKLTLAIAEIGPEFLTKDQAAVAKKIKEEFERISKLRNDIKRVDDAFSKPIQQANADLINLQYGKDAERVRLLVAQSVDTERKTLDFLVATHATYEEIRASANAYARERADTLALLESEVQQLEKIKEQERKREEEQKRVQAEAERLKEFTRNLERQLQYQQDLLNMSKEEARIRQLMREQGADRRQAAEIQQLEKQVESYKELEKLRKDAEKLVRDANPFADFIDDMARLQAMLEKGFIDQQLFDQERQQLINNNVRLEGLKPATAVKQGSQEAFQALSRQYVDRVQQQLKETRAQTLLQKTQTRLDERRNQLLQDLVDDQPDVVGV